MTLYISGLVIFFGLHLYSAFRSRQPGKDRREVMGEKIYMGLYSVAALIGFILIIAGFGASRPSPILYTPPAWGVAVNLLLSGLAFIALTASQIPAGHIKKSLKHPMLVGIKLWALGHLLSNGELNAALLFGAFLGFAVIDRIRVKRRGDNGAAAAQPNVIWDGVAIFVGLALYAAFIIKLHPLLIGVAIVP